MCKEEDIDKIVISYIIEYMEILRYSMDDADVGDEWKVISNLRKIGIPKDSVHLDKKVSPPQILIEIHTREIGDLVRTIANIRNLKRQPAPVPT